MLVILSILSWLSGALVFCLMAVVLLVVAGVVSPRSYDPVLKAMCRLIVRCFPVRIQIEGLSRLDRNRGYLFVANHVNLLDGFLLYGHLPWLFRGVELESHFSWPIYGWFIRTFGNIPVSPANAARSAAGLLRAGRLLAAGRSILVLPEGRRTITGALGAFGKGAFSIAKRAGAEIVPIVMAGAYYVMRKGRMLVRPGTVRVVIGAPITAAEHASMDVNRLRDLVRSRMLVMLKEAGERGDQPLGPAGASDPGRGASDGARGRT